MTEKPITPRTMRNKNNNITYLGSSVIGGVIILLGFSATEARAQVSLGEAASFAVLSATTVTNTGNTLIYGNVGVSPGTAITGFGPGVVEDGTSPTGVSANQAHLDAESAYYALQAMTGATDRTGADLGDSVWNPGIYSFSSSVGLTGTLVLDGQGLTNPQFVFQIGSTLVTASDSNVIFRNGASAENVFWQVGSSATLGTGTQFAGTIIALTSITATTNATVNSGRLLAINGAVTLDTNQINSPSPVPEPSTAMLLIPVTMILLKRRRI